MASLPLQPVDAKNPLASANLPINVNATVVAEAINTLRTKLIQALADGHFSQIEVMALVMATIHAVNKLFPLLSGPDKKDTVKVILQTLIRYLQNSPGLDPLLAESLSYLPLDAIIDSLVALAQQAGGWWDTFKLWCFDHCRCGKAGPVHSATTIAKILAPNSTASSEKQIRLTRSLLDQVEINTIKENAQSLAKIVN